MILGIHQFLIVSRGKRLLFGNHVVNTDHHHTCNGDNGFLVTTTLFDTSILAIILDKPVVKPLDIRVNGGKRFLIILGNSVLAGGYDGCNDNIFVDIKPIADGVF